MKNYQVTYTHKNNERTLKARVASEEDAILQGLTLWQLPDNKTSRKKITVKAIKGAI